TALERKIDALLNRILDTTPPELDTTRTTHTPQSTTRGVTPPPATTTSTVARTTRPNAASGRSDLDSGRTSSGTTNPLRELEVQLKLALEAFVRAEELFRRHSISVEEREQTRGVVLLTAAQLEELDEDFNDEIERLKLEMRRKQAECEKAEAQTEVARA